MAWNHQKSTPPCCTPEYPDLMLPSNLWECPTCNTFWRWTRNHRQVRAWRWRRYWHLFRKYSSPGHRLSSRFLKPWDAFWYDLGERGQRRRRNSKPHRDEQARQQATETRP